MDRDFEKFLGGANVSTAKRLHVTLSPAKLILLNRNLFTLMGKPEAVNLGYSRTRDTIAIEPASLSLATSFPVLPSGHAFRINAAPFCRHFNIKIDTTLKFIRPNLEGRTLYLKLSETISVGRGKRKKK